MVSFAYSMTTTVIVKASSDKQSATIKEPLISLTLMRLTHYQHQLQMMAKFTSTIIFHTELKATFPPKSNSYRKLKYANSFQVTIASYLRMSTVILISMLSFPIQDEITACCADANSSKSSNCREKLKKK
jgi:hypothetical protein